MSTFLTNRRMAPALRARVEASVTGRAGPRSKPARFRAFLRLLFLLSGVATLVWTFAHNRIAGRELERRRSSLLSDLRAQSSSVDARQRGSVAAAEAFLRNLANSYEGDVAANDVVAPDALTRPMIYVRGPVEAFRAGASIENAAIASLDEAFVRCLFDPPHSRKERDVLAKVRAAYAATAPLPSAHRLADAYIASLFLAPAFEASVRGADEHQLTVLEQRVERAHLSESKKALGAELLLAVMDDPGDPKVPADLDGERPHDVRIEIVDTISSKVVHRSRKHVDPSAWSTAARAEYASGLDSCALAYDARHPEPSKVNEDDGGAARR